MYPTPSDTQAWFDRDVFADPPRIAGNSGKIGFAHDTAGNVPDKSKVEDLLAAVKASDDPRFMQSENHGIPGLLNRLVRSLSQVRTGVDYDPYVFRQVFEAVDVKGQNFLGQTDKKVTTAVGRPRSMRPLYHLDQFYRNWAMATPHILLAGRIIWTTDSNYMWYGPTFNPLGFELIASNSVQSYSAFPPSYPKSNPGSAVWGGDKLKRFNLRIKTPADTYIFSVNATHHSSWKKDGNTQIATPWDKQPTDAAATPITVHVGSGGPSENITWDQDIFLAGTADGATPAVQPWCYITVVGTNPNYTADYVYRGVKGPTIGGETSVNAFATSSPSNNVRGAAHAMEATGWADRMADLAAAEKAKLGDSVTVAEKGYGREVSPLDWTNIGANPTDSKSMGYGNYNGKPSNPKTAGDGNKNAGGSFYEPNSGGWWQWRKPNG